MLKTVNATPAVFGLLRAAVHRLEQTAVRRGEDEGIDLARRLAREGGLVRAEVYRLIDDVPAEEEIERRLSLRAHAMELTVRATTALVAAGAGASMGLGSPAQRMAREALFHIVQAQTAPVRTATLRRLSDITGRPTLPSSPSSTT